MKPKPQYLLQWSGKEPSTFLGISELRAPINNAFVFYSFNEAVKWILLLRNPKLKQKLHVVDKPQQ